MLRTPLVLVLSLLLSLTRLDAQKITLRQVGRETMLFNNIGYFPMNGMLYTVDFNGAVSKTTLDSGVHTRLGTTAFKNGKFFFGIYGKLYILETDGSMDEIDPFSGNWKTISTMGVWTRTERVVVVRNNLYTIENGAFYHHRMVNYDNKDQLGGSEFYNVGALFRSENALYSLLRDGSFYEINTSTGEWKRIGRSKPFKNMKAGAVMGGKFYAVNESGVLSETLLSDGSMTNLDSEQFVKTMIMFNEAGKLFVVMKDGTLFEVQGI